MNKRSIKRAGQAAVVALGAYLVAGGPLQAASSWITNATDVQEAVAQEAAIQEASGDAVAFETCAVVEDWQRPSAEEQAKQLAKDARYDIAASNIASNSSEKAVSTQFWDQPVVSFTTYGLSARMEPTNWTGLWTVDSEMQNCYTPETTAAINEGDRAEAWLVNHRIESLVWTGDRYVMTVAPTATGAQVVQFERSDELASLPLDVVNESGEVVEVVSGDWE